MLNSVDEVFVRGLHEVLPEGVIRPVEGKYLVEPRGAWRGQAGVVLTPNSVDQVSRILRLANTAHVPVVPYGGGTGLVGGQVMPDGPTPIVLSLERLNKIRAIHTHENVLVVEAGVILADVQAAAENVKRLFPLAIASQGSAQIGGNLATNAGGVNVLRYGTARDLCLGIEAVMPDGQIWHGLTRLRKDNTGYDLRNLLIGSEGTLGVITAATLKMFPRPNARGVALMVVESPAAALSLLSLARDQFGEAVSAFELIHQNGLAFLAEVGLDVRQPFKDMPQWMVLIDLGLAKGLDPEIALSNLFETGVEVGLVSDGVIAQSMAQIEAFWNIREAIPEANKRIGSLASHDVSVPLGEISAFIDRADAALAALGTFRINCFGHLGDGNLHYNVFPPKGRNRNEYPMAFRKEISETVHDLVADVGGSFSAEHGVGRLKIGDLERYGDPVKLSMMRGIKALFDPNGIMNPGAVLNVGK